MPIDPLARRIPTPQRTHVAVTTMQRYLTASEGWKFPAPGRAIAADAIRIHHRPLVKEPDGIRHAFAPRDRQTLCGLPLDALIEFDDVGFSTARPSDRCTRCEGVTQLDSPPKRPTSDRAR